MAERDRFLYMRFNKSGVSSSMEEANLMFPRQDSAAPRLIIYKNECPSELKEFNSCMERTGGNLSECSGQKDTLDKCGNKFFKEINAMTTPYNYVKGLSG